MTKAFRTALAYSVMIAAMVITVNLLTSPGFLWFVFPLFGVIWWPMSVYFTGKKRPFAYAVCGAALLSALFTATYLVTGAAGFPWFIYPILGVIWWPLSVYFKERETPLVFAVCGFSMIAAIFVSLYLFTSPGAHPWFIYPVLGVFWWPLSVWGVKKGARAFSVAGGLYVILTVLVINLAASPAFWWWVYPAFLVLWWPLSVLLGEKAKTFAFAAGSAAAAILFTVVMHRIQTPGALPWYLYTMLPILWWPVTKLLYPRVDRLRLTLISIIAFVVYYAGLAALLHGMSSLLAGLLLLGGIWFVFAAGVSKHRDSPAFAAANAVLLGVFFYAVHRLITPDIHPWFLYALFPLLWWPVSAMLKEKAVRPLPVAACAILGLLYYGALNLFASPGTPWILFLTFPAAAAVIGSVCREHRSYTQLSIWMSAAGIAYFAVINLAFTPHTIWAVYPAFAILWWPLSMWLYGRRNVDEEEE
jgi:hypothetical protein